MMTLEEFREEILPLVKDEDLGIKNLTGYDILKKIQLLILKKLLRNYLLLSAQFLQA